MEDIKIFLKEKKKKSENMENMVVNVTKISQKMEEKLVECRKNIIE